MIWITMPWQGYLAAVFFGIGIGGVLTVLPIAWADYFGRKSFGAIRGVALSIPVVGQAVGPLVSGILRDQTGDYALSLWTFTGLSWRGHRRHAGPGTTHIGQQTVYCFPGAPKAN
ncbi:MAG: hypothetical protein Ct9H300mP16_10860 [Pseudomonadota bacterium]|nr:MAG: hypothetical protein Ct9H300mP16_10860 [Pseudomonadota bacterium]